MKFLLGDSNGHLRNASLFGNLAPIPSSSPPGVPIPYFMWGFESLGIFVDFYKIF